MTPDRQLFDFLCALLQGQVKVETPLILDQHTLNDIYHNPHPDLQKALSRCVERLLLEISPNTSQWENFQLSPGIWAFAIAFYNALIPAPFSASQTDENLLNFTNALIDTMPPFDTLNDMIAGHAVLQPVSEQLNHISPPHRQIILRLLHLEPLSGLYHLNIYIPPALTPLAAEKIPGWKKHVMPVSPWKTPEDWFHAMETLISTNAITRYLHRRWLTLPKERPTFRNLGLLLESLRMREHHRDFLLQFYEAFDFSNGKTMTTVYGKKVRHWPILKHIEGLLQTSGQNEDSMNAAMRLNRWGHEFFFLFYPLTQIVREEKGIPKEYHYLNPGWIPALRPFLDYINEAPAAHFEHSDISFESQWEKNNQEKTSKDDFQYKVILHNDDTSTMEFVVYVLEKVFGISMEEAVKIMLNVHNEGTGNCGIFPYDTAQEKVNQVTDLAKEHGFPLKCTMERDNQ